MAQIVIMPRQGQSVESCIITEWRKKEGESVSVGDILFAYETDKSSFEEPSQFSGVILKIFANDGDVVPCLEPVCAIGEAGEVWDGPESGDNKADEATVTRDIEISKENDSVATAPVVTESPVNHEGRVFISPRAKNLALKCGVDMTKVVPTGPHGRIIERDITAALDAGYRKNPDFVRAFLAGEVVSEETPAVETVEVKTETAASPVTSATADDFRAYTEAPLTNVRKVIAKSMHSSLSEMAQLTLNSSFDASAVLAYREKLKAAGEALGLGKITINDIVLYAVSRTLKDFPDINANLVDNKMRTFKHANIGVAVDTERGLLVPVIFGADTLSLAEISENMKTLAKDARSGSLSPDLMSGGSFTVSNLGSMGIESFTPVINPPQTAILGVCATTYRLRADGTTYPAMGLSLTFDHRAVDGAPAAKFLKQLCTNLENFELLLAK